MLLCEPQLKPLFENKLRLWILKEYEIVQNLNLLKYMSYFPQTEQLCIPAYVMRQHNW